MATKSFVSYQGNKIISQFPWQQKKVSAHMATHNHFNTFSSDVKLCLTKLVRYR
jgi:hypothetical protein